jgi:cardiolipin synthase
MSPPRRRSLLRPWSGRRLPRALRARRVGALAGTLPRGLLDPGFAALLERIDTGRVHRGNRAFPYFEGAHAFGAMCEASAAARRELLVESYFLRDDDTGERFGEALAAAAARGVAVKVLADALGSAETRSDFWDRLRAQGIEARLFHPALPYFWNQLVRDHRKILIADREVAFTGGMNIGDEYGSSVRSKSGPEERTWRDTHVRVTGPVVTEMVTVFEEGWTRAEGEPLGVEQASTGEGGEGVLVLDSRPHRGHRESASVLAAIVGAARRTVWITNAYFAPRRIAIDLLGNAVDRGVDVRLLLPGRTDVPLVRHAGHGYFAALLRRGVGVYEYQAAILHAKTLVADGAVSVIGSSNLDFRSFRFNAECNLTILGEETGGELDEAFRRDLEQSVEIDRAGWRRRSLGHRVGDRAARWLSPLL